MAPDRLPHLRNVAIVAHVDHGKTTLVDALLRQSGLLKGSGEATERVMDSFFLERERGITILAKNTAVTYRGVKINILDTPGHHDFGGEVERTLTMAEGIVLLVDAAEGCLPQTRFVLEKALARHLPVIVVINKIDRKDARSAEVLDEIYDLFIDLGADDAQIDFPVLYANGRAGLCTHRLEDAAKATDLKPLFEAILEHIPPPIDRREEPFRLLVSNLGWDDYVGRLMLGRIESGSVRMGQVVYVLGDAGRVQPGKVMRLYTYNGLTRTETDSASCGDIVSVAGIQEVTIGDTLVTDAEIPALPRVRVDEPTLAMNFYVNTSPFAGRDGTFVTSRNLRTRLEREALANVALHVSPIEGGEGFRVVGRGELQLAILAETMIREGYELMLSRPEVVTREIDGKLHEPIELLTIDCPDTVLGPLTEVLGRRKGRLTDMSRTRGRARLTFRIPTRGLIGFHSDFLTETRGEGLMSTAFDGWIPWLGPIVLSRNGSLVADREGETVAYGLFHLQARGTLFVGPGVPVYEGMVVGEHTRKNDLNINCTRGRKLTNLRAAGKDENIILTPPRTLSIESAIEFVGENEFVELTPKAIRVRKKFLPAGMRSKDIRRGRKDDKDKDDDEAD
jgi:GTP-binding protein